MAAAGLAVLIPLAAAEAGLRLYFRISGRSLYAYPAGEREYVENWLVAHEDNPRGEITGYAEYDPDLGWRTRPGMKDFAYDDGAERRPPVTTNSIGARGEREYSPVKPSGVTRIVAVGDSFTFGFEASEGGDWPALAEGQLDRAEVINLGVIGYGADQMLLRLERDGLPLGPDVVVMGFFEDDADRCMFAFREFAKPVFEIEEGALKLSNVPVPSPEEVLTRMGRRSPRLYLRHVAREKLRRPPPPAEAAGYAGRRAILNRAILERMAGRTREAGARLLVVFIPLDGRYELAQSPIRRELIEWAPQLGYELCDLAETFGEALRSGGRSPYSSHFNEYGNLLAANAVRARLVELGWAKPAPDEVVERAERLAGELARLAGGGGYRDALSEGKARIAKGDAAGAVAPLETAARLSPDPSEALVLLGSIRETAGDLEGALANYTAAHRARSSCIQARNGAANLLAKMGRREEAVEQYEEALRLRPDFAEAHNNLGTTLDEMGRAEPAIAHLKEAIRIRPDYPEAWNNLGVALAGTGRIKEAKEAFEAALRHRPDFASAKANLATVMSDPRL